MTGIRFRTITHEVHDTDITTLTAQLEKLENVPDAPVTAAGLRCPVDGQDVWLDDAAAVAIVLALMPPATETPEREQVDGELGYRLRALRRRLEAELGRRSPTLGLEDLDWLRRLLKDCRTARDRLEDEPSLGALKADLDAYCLKIERKLEQAQSISGTRRRPPCR